MPLNLILTQVAAGTLGSFAVGVDNLNALARRLHGASQRGAVPDRSGQVLQSMSWAFGAEIDQHLATCICAPSFAHAPDWQGAAARNDVIVCFDGHLVEPVPGIDVPVSRPADIVRQAYGRWGAECLGTFNGNYCVTVLDPVLSTLFVARDDAGSKPLFYCFTDHLVFGTSAIAVLHASGIPAVADPHGLHSYLANGYVAGTRHTLLKNIHALTRGEYLSAKPGQAPQLHVLASNSQDRTCRAHGSLDDTAQSLRSLLLATISGQSRDARVGIALSGGIDSSGILACLREAQGSHAPIDVFTYVHDHPSLPPEWNEQQWAELAAESAGATLHKVTLQSAAIPDMMARIFKSQDFPFGSPVILAQAEVFRVAAEAGMQVMLSGHGPDVLLGGGNSHIIARLSGMLRHARLFDAWRLATGASRYAGRPRDRLLLSGAYHLALRLGLARRRHANPGWARRSWFADRLGSVAEEPVAQHADSMTQMVLDQLGRTTIPSSLLWEGCNATAFGLDNRLPYLVPSMIRLARSMPAQYLVSNTGETKSILRHALAGLVPDPILGRRERVGFAVPALPWLRELRPWVQAHLNELEALPFFDGSSRHLTGDGFDAGALTSALDAFQCWRWIALQEWIREHGVVFE